MLVLVLILPAQVSNKRRPRVQASYCTILRVLLLHQNGNVRVLLLPIGFTFPKFPFAMKGLCIAFKDPLCQALSDVKFLQAIICRSVCILTVLTQPFA